MEHTTSILLHKEDLVHSQLFSTVRKDSENDQRRQKSFQEIVTQVGNLKIFFFVILQGNFFLLTGVKNCQQFVTR